jgi:integrase
VPRAWIEIREVKGGKRYRVKFRVGGRSSPKLYGGTFAKKREAEARRDWILGELAQMRVPRLELLRPAPTVTVRDVAHRWLASRVDVAGRTTRNHGVDLSRILPRLGDRPVASIAPSDVVELVAQLHDDGEGLARETIRKTIGTLAMVLDFHGVMPNPARDRTVRMPREEPEEFSPPIASHVREVHRLLPRLYRLPLLVLDATGMRVGELEGLVWGDVDERAGRWRVRRAVAKTRQARWVPVPEAVFGAVVELVPRDDRDLDAQVFAGVSADALRTAIAKASRAAGVPVFSPHDLRHRRATLWQLTGVPAIEGAHWLGHSPVEHAKTYGHAAIADRSELDYANLLGRDRARSDGALPGAPLVWERV